LFAETQEILIPLATKQKKKTYNTATSAQCTTVGWYFQTTNLRKFQNMQKKSVLLQFWVRLCQCSVSNIVYA